MFRHRFEKLIMMLGLVAALLLLKQGVCYAFGLGIPALDGFMTNLEQGVPRCGLLMALIGGAALTMSKFDTHFNSFLSGYLTYFVTVGIFGGLGAMLLALGLQS